MKLIFGSNPWPGSLLIRLATFSQWSHVGIVYGDYVVEAKFPRVRQTTVGNFIAHYPKWEFAELPCANEAKAESWAMSRIGKLYDVGGLIAFPFQQRDWESRGRYFCSELPILAAAEGGTRYVRDGARSRVTPGQLYDLSF